MAIARYIRTSSHPRYYNLSMLLSLLLPVLNLPGSVKVLGSKYDKRDYRGARVKRTTVTAIECISADSKYLNPIII